MRHNWFAVPDSPLRPGLSTRSWGDVLVPLDGSELSTWALVRARTLLEHQGISVSLLRVVECGEDRAKDLGYQMDSRHREASDALGEIRGGFLGRSRDVGAELRFGDPATEILREIDEGNHDVVLLSTFGRPGLGRSLFGKVAQQVLRASPVPLLLFRPRPGSDEAFSHPGAFSSTTFTRLLVVLDGSETAEEILPSAERMARTLGSTIHLFRGVPEGAGEAIERARAEEYLEKWRRTLESRGIRAEAVVRTGIAAESAVALIRELGIDGVALTTQLRTGLARSVHGSLTEEILRAADLPVLTLCPLARRNPLPQSDLDRRHVRVEAP